MEITYEEYCELKDRVLTLEEQLKAARLPKKGIALAYLVKERPISHIKEYFQNDDKDCVETYSDIYDFITFENSPVYLPDLIEGSEGE